MFELNKECKGETRGEKKGRKKSVCRHAHEKESRCKIPKQTYGPICEGVCRLLCFPWIS